jgi:TRAP transporter 4TM/12TM fusion protein
METDQAINIKQIRGLMVLMLGVIMSLFHLYSAGIGLLPTPVQRSIHLALALALVFWLYPSTDKKWALGLDGLLAFLAVIGAGYIAVFHEDIAFRGGRPLRYELYLGLMTMVLVLEAGRRVLGKILPILGIIFLIYCYAGQYAPWIFQHRGVSINRLVQHMYLTHEGLFGVALGVSSTYIFMFILFGAFLANGGGIRLFNNVAMALTGRMSGGPAKVAVVASALMGTINGSSVANVATTGAVTIPLMKKAGFAPETAGAIEACASTGGQLMPPIMGAGAFIMAEFLGISYLTIAAAAVLPSILYFLSIFLSVHFIANKEGLGGVGGGPKLGAILMADGHLAVPLFVVIGLLLAHYTPLMASFVGIISLVVIGAARAGTRMGPKKILFTLADGAKGGVVTATACAVVGFLVGTFSLTGLGLSLSTNIVELTEGVLWSTLILAMIACLILGMGLPTTANYIVTSTVIAPALAKLGVIPLAAHLFIFYFGIIADITPPVCLASITAAGLASASSYKTGLKAFALSWPSFLLPFVFIYSPEIILQRGSFLDIAAVAGAAALGLLAVCSAFHGYLNGLLSAGQRILLLTAGLALYFPSPFLKIGGLLLLTAVLLVRLARQKSVLRPEQKT